MFKAFEEVGFVSIGSRVVEQTELPIVQEVCRYCFRNLSGDLFISCCQFLSAEGEVKHVSKNCPYAAEHAVSQ